MSVFTTNRERRLWLWAAAVLVAIWAGLWFAGSLAEVLRGRGLLSITFTVAFLSVIVAILGSAFRRRAGRAELWVLIGIIAVYAVIIVRMGITPEERTHLFEYGLLAVLVYHALLERRRHGGAVPSPAVLAFLITVFFGLMDEAIQGLLPHRVYDPRDVGFNVLAGLMAISASASLAWVRRRTSGRRQN